MCQLSMTYPRREKRKATVVENRPTKCLTLQHYNYSHFGAKIQIFEKVAAKIILARKFKYLKNYRIDYFGAKIQMFEK